MRWRQLQHVHMGRRVSVSSGYSVRIKAASRPFTPTNHDQSQMFNIRGNKKWPRFIHHSQILRTTSLGPFPPEYSVCKTLTGRPGAAPYPGASIPAGRTTSQLPVCVEPPPQFVGDVRREFATSAASRREGKASAVGHFRGASSSGCSRLGPAFAAPAARRFWPFDSLQRVVRIPSAHSRPRPTQI